MVLFGGQGAVRTLRVGLCDVDAYRAPDEAADGGRAAISGERAFTNCVGGMNMLDDLAK